MQNSRPHIVGLPSRTPQARKDISNYTLISINAHHPITRYCLLLYKARAMTKPPTKARLPEMALLEAALPLGLGAPVPVELVPPLVGLGLVSEPVGTVELSDGTSDGVAEGAAVGLVTRVEDSTAELDLELVVGAAELVVSTALVLLLVELLVGSAVAEALPEEEDDDEPPVMWKGNERWKVLGSDSSLISKP